MHYLILIFVIVFDQWSVFSIRVLVIIRSYLSKKAIGQNDSSFVPKLAAPRGYNGYYGSKRKLLFYTHTIGLETYLSLWTGFGVGLL